MTKIYFGEPWPAPALAGAHRVNTPVGQECWYCHVDIVDGDRGYVDDAVSPLVVGGQPSGYRIAAIAIHRECQLRSVLGSTYDLEGRCQYVGHCHELLEAEGKTIRQDALDLWDLVQRQVGAKFN